MYMNVYSSPSIFMLDIFILTLVVSFIFYQLDFKVLALVKVEKAKTLESRGFMLVAMTIRTIF